MAFRLIPKEQSFFDLFEQLADKLQAASRLLTESTQQAGRLAEIAKQMERLEHEGDLATHEIMARLNRTFITPIDREDIHELATSLDNLLDVMEESSERFVLYRVTAIPPEAQEQAKVIEQQVEQIHQAIPKLRHMRHERIIEHCVEINRLENVADRIFRGAIAGLFDRKLDPLEVIKWRELFGLLESATDECEDVAIAIEGIVLKNT